jgi:integrase
MLTDTFVKQQVKPIKPNGDKYADGGGHVSSREDDGKYWRMDYRHLNKRKTLALGVYPDVSLAKARKRRDEARELLADGIDPAQSKREMKQAQVIASGNTFEIIARQWLSKTSANRAVTTQAKITNWLESNVFPVVGKQAISTIGPRDVLAAVRRMEARGAIDSAHRVKQICSQVFRYAVAVGAAERDVTTDLRGALAAIPKSHFAAITEPKQVGELLRAIHGYTGHPYTVAALKLSPMVFVRPGELRAPEWAELDLDAAEWRIPASKIKMGVEHLVPLPAQAVEVVRSVHAISGHGRYVFPSIRTGERCMSENTVNAALRGMGYTKEVMTAHGFRATARTILDEVLGERPDLIEHQLAHAVRDPNGRAYNRTSHLPERKRMMQRWADYLDSLRKGADVIQLREA